MGPIMVCAHEKQVISSWERVEEASSGLLLYSPDHREVQSELLQISQRENFNTQHFDLSVLIT